MEQPNKRDVVVIGGGIIGLCVAERLAHEGFAVTIIEKDAIAAGASAGNAAGIAFSEIMPLASAGTIRKSIKWLVDPTGPFAVVPQDLPGTLGWLVRFALATRRSTYDRSVKTLATMMQLEQKVLPALLSRTGLESMVRESGALYLYESKAEFKADLGNWKLRENHGIEFERFEDNALHEFQTGLAKNIVAGIHVPKYQTVSDPKDYCIALHNVIEGKVETRYQSAASISTNDDGVAVHIDDGSTIEASKVVLATGAWSAKFCAQLGDKVPLIGERGYNTTMPKSAFPELDKPMFFTSRGFVMSPLSNGVRVGGASEIASLDRAPDYKRSRAMLAIAKTLVPKLDLQEGAEWMGIRPSTPDTLPIVSRSSKSQNVIYAFGHGHLGLSLASSTAQLVADLVLGRQPAMDIGALRAQRF